MPPEPLFLAEEYVRLTRSLITTAQGESGAEMEALLAERERVLDALEFVGLDEPASRTLEEADTFDQHLRAILHEQHEALRSLLVARFQTRQSIQGYRTGGSDLDSSVAC